MPCLPKSWRLLLALQYWPKKSSERTLPGFFRVRRECVRRALEWLTEHTICISRRLFQSLVWRTTWDGILMKFQTIAILKIRPSRTRRGGICGDDADTMEVRQDSQAKSLIHTLVSAETNLQNRSGANGRYGSWLYRQDEEWTSTYLVGRVLRFWW